MSISTQRATVRSRALRSYASLALLQGGILIGAAAGALLHQRAAVLKPLGDVFLNLLSTAVAESMTAGDAIARAFTVDDFAGLLSKQNMLARQVGETTPQPHARDASPGVA